MLSENEIKILDERALLARKSQILVRMIHGYLEMTKLSSTDKKIVIEFAAFNEKEQKEELDRINMKIINTLLPYSD